MLLAGLTLQAALAIGFALTLALWLTTGYRMTRQMQTLETRAAEINDRYIRAQSQLSALRAHVLVASVLIRDALLDANPAMARVYRQRLTQTYEAADRALREYQPVLGHEDERRQLADLRTEIDEFREMVLEVLDAGVSIDADTVIRDRIMPQREVATRMSEQVQTMNREAFVRQGVETSELYQAAQRDAGRRLGLALILSIGVGLSAATYARRLERHVRHQHVRDRQLTTELQHLSTGLVSAQEHERRSIARELHDEVGQALAAVKVELAVAEAACGTPDLVPRLQRVRSIAEGALQRIRSLSHVLHPALLDDLGLEAALEAYVRSVEQRHGLDVVFTRDPGGARRLAPELETAVYRIVQEAVTNVVAHAHATRCQVDINGLAQSVRVTVEDNGSGFDPGPAGGPRPTAGLGLISMRERVAQFGGVFQIEAAPGRGTRVTIEMPALPPGRAQAGVQVAQPSTLSEVRAHGAPSNLPG